MPHILIPLSAAASRGDQILNAASFKKQGFSVVLQDEEVNKESLLGAIKEIEDNRQKYVSAMNGSASADSEEIIFGLIEKTRKQ